MSAALVDEANANGDDLLTMCGHEPEADLAAMLLHSAPRGPADADAPRYRSFCIRCLARAHVRVRDDGPAFTRLQELNDYYLDRLPRMPRRKRRLLEAAVARGAGRV